MILLKVPFKWERPSEGIPIYRTSFSPGMEYEKNNLRTLRDPVYGVWDYRPPWPYSGITDFTAYENISFLEGGGMVMWVGKKDGERYTGARMQTMRHTGKCKAWDYFRMEADMELPDDLNVVAAWWVLTKTHPQPNPFWCDKNKKIETEKITPELDWPETSTERIRDEGEKKFNIAYHYGLTHYPPHRKHKDRQFPPVKGRHTWFIEKRRKVIYYGIDNEVKYVQVGAISPEPMYPIFWITVPSWAPLGYDPKGCNMKVYSFKVFRVYEK